MIRSSKHTIKFSNFGKQVDLARAFAMYNADVTTIINRIVTGELELKKIYSSKELIGLLCQESHWKTFAANAASEVIRSQKDRVSTLRFNRYRKVYTRAMNSGKFKWFTSKKFSELKLKQFYRTKYVKIPTLKNISIELTEMVLNIQEGNSFDEFIRITLPWEVEKKLKSGKVSSEYKKVKIPIKFHKQSWKFASWTRKKTIKLQQESISFFYENEIPSLKGIGETIGLDCGYKKLLIDNTGVTYDVGLEEVYKKIARKKQGSKKFKRVLKERDCKINESVKGINFAQLRKIIVENLKNVKSGSKFSKKFNNKLQRWSYPKVLDKLSQVCEEVGIELMRVDPAYTSQTCSCCGKVDRESRKGESFCCTRCGMKMDADHNAAVNILHRGEYDPSAGKVNSWG